MKILNNPILGKILNRYALLLNDKGLFRKIRTTQGSYLIFITDDYKKVAELFDLDYNVLNDLDLEDACEYISKSKYFLSEIFTESSESNPLLINMISEMELPKTETINPIDTARVMEVVDMPQLLTIIDGAKKDLPIAIGNYKTNFEKMKNLLLENGYDKRNFQKDLENFFESFDTKWDKFLTMEQLSTQELVDIYTNI
jgi:hypothetical protein